MNEKIDQMIMSIVNERWQKVAMVVATVLLDGGEEFYSVDDISVAERVAALVEEGKLESQGDLSEMRYSEVRLANS